MKLKRTTRIACISAVLLVGALFLLVALNFDHNSGSAHTDFSFTPRKWRFMLRQEWMLMDTNGVKSGMMWESRVGPVVVRQWE